MLPEDVGTRIKHERILKALTQEALAAMANTSAQTIYRIENGLATPRLSTIKRISDALGLPVERFTREDTSL